jgi:hypothetical protein
MFRDDRVAGRSRIAALENELSALRAQTAPPDQALPRVGPTRRVLAGGLALVIFLVAAVFLLGRPYNQTVLQHSTGHMLSVVFWVPVTDVTWEHEDTHGQLEPFTVPATDLAGTPLGSRAATVMLPPSAVNQAGETKLILRYRALARPWVASRPG